MFMLRRDLIGKLATCSALAAGLLSISYSIVVDGGSSVGFVAGLVAGHVAIACVLAAVWSTGQRTLLLLMCALFFLTAQAIGGATALIPISQVVGYTVGMVVTFLLGLSLSALAGLHLEDQHRIHLNETRKPLAAARRPSQPAAGIGFETLLEQLPPEQPSVRSVGFQ